MQEVAYPMFHLGGVDFGGYFRSCQYLCMLDKNMALADNCRNGGLICVTGSF